MIYSISEFIDLMKKFDQNYLNQLKKFELDKVKYDGNISYWVDAIIDNISHILMGEKRNVDLIVSFHQFMKYTNEKISISNYLYEIVKLRIIEYNIEVFSYDNFVELHLSDLHDELNIVCNRIYSLNQKSESLNLDIVGDPWFYSCTGHKNYKSISQKIFIDHLIHQGKGNTSLIVMPTGSGKSITGLSPTMFENEKLLTVVVMPTVSLTIDQSINYKNLFAEGEVVGYYSTDNFENKSNVIDSLNKKKIRVLYISPEAILNPTFRKALIKAAEEKYFCRLIIDECHLVDSWGKLFRTEFQMLGQFKDEVQLLYPEFETILLSATITNHDLKILKSIFSNDKNLLSFRADALRDEVVFYHSVVSDKKSKDIKLINEIKILPKPMIIYCHKPSDAEHIIELVNKKLEIFRVSTFTGNTNNTERLAIINAWKNNQIDIIIATSAFGMGVDKPNVRTVLHYYIPSNIKDYYQEVGRGGRDGYEFLARTLVNPQEDFKITNGQMLSYDIFVERLNSMLREKSKIDFDEFWISTSSVRVDLELKQTGSKNSAWNIYVLFILVNANIIKIIDILNESNGNKNSKLFKVKIVDADILFDTEVRKQKIINILNQNNQVYIEESQRIIKYFKGFAKKCISDFLVEEFKLVEAKCNGCNSCGYNQDFFEIANSIGKNHIIESDQMQKYIVAFEKKFSSNYICVLSDSQMALDVISKLADYFAPVVLSENMNFLNTLISTRVKTKVITCAGLDLFDGNYSNRIVIVNLLEESSNFYKKLINYQTKNKFILIVDANTKGRFKTYIVDELNEVYKWKMLERILENE